MPDPIPFSIRLSETSNAGLKPEMKRPSGRTSLGFLLAGMVALGLGACANTNNRADPLATGSIEMDGYKTRHPIVLAESAETMDIPVGRQSSKLSPRMAHTVAVFAEQSRTDGASHITILVPSGAANDAEAYRMSQQVAAALQQGGIPRSAISRSDYLVEEGTVDAPLRIAYARTKAVVTHRCGVWPASVGTGNVENNDDYDFGCATQSNIAAMVANPSDLVTPTGEDAPNVTRRTQVIGKYRDGSKTQTDATVTPQLTGGN